MSRQRYRVLNSTCVDQKIIGRIGEEVRPETDLVDRTAIKLYVTGMDDPMDNGIYYFNPADLEKIEDARGAQIMQNTELLWLLVRSGFQLSIKPDGYGNICLMADREGSHTSHVLDESGSLDHAIVRIVADVFEPALSRP